MRRVVSAALICTALMAPGRTQNASSGPELQAALTFETEHDGTSPRGWGGGPPSTISVDGDIVHGGRWSARLERTAATTQPFTTLTKAIPVDFGGTTIVFRGFLRSENVSDFMALWMRLDGDIPNLAFSSMQSRQIKGTNEWTEYMITMPFHRDAKQLFFGVLLGGTGKVWADDLQLLVDGEPVWTAPRVERPKTALDLDQQFDKGSGIVDALHREPGRGHRIRGAILRTGHRPADWRHRRDARRHVCRRTGQAMGATLSRVEPADAVT